MHSTGPHNGRAEVHILRAQGAQAELKVILVKVFMPASHLTAGVVRMHKP